jgi:hypothetical protein
MSTKAVAASAIAASGISDPLAIVFMSRALMTGRTPSRS